MQNKTPILVLTGLAVVAVAAIAGLTRDRWMGATPQVASTTQQPAPATPPAAPKTVEQAAPAITAEAPKTAEQPAAPSTPAAVQTTEQPPAKPAEVTTSAATAPATAEQPAAPATAPAQQTSQATAEQPALQPEQPAAKNAAAQPKVPTFDTVRVEKTGDAVIAGTAAPGAEVVVKLDGQQIGQTTANADGAFVVVPAKPLPSGSGALTLEAQTKGDAAAVASEQSVAVIVPAADKAQEALVAVVSPDQPTKVLQKPEAVPPAATSAPAATPAEKPAKLVSIDAVDYDAAGNIVFSGQGDKGNTARIYIDNNIVGDAAVGDDGRWTFSGTAQVAPGVHSLRVDGIDSAGKVLNRVEVPFFREQQNKVADATTAAQPAQPAQTTQPAQTAQPAQTSQPAQSEAAQPATPPAASAGTEVTKTPEAPAAQPQQTTTTAAAQTTTTTTPTAPAQTTTTTATTAATTAMKPKEGRVVIQPGNNLWRISRVLYGTGNKYTMLYEANKEQIRNPDLIYPGQVFKTPDVAPKVEKVDPSRRHPLKPDENAASGQ